MRKTVAGSSISLRFRREETPMLQIFRARARASRRASAGQLKYFALLGMVATDNPDLPASFIQGVLEGLEESRTGRSAPYAWGVLKW